MESFRELHEKQAEIAAWESQGNVQRQQIAEVELGKMLEFDELESRIALCPELEIEP